MEGQTDPIFLTLDEVLEIHTDSIQSFGGTEGIRDLELLQSALAMPGAGMGDDYFHKDIYEMAAAYLFHITKNHPFVDGNKRVGAAAAHDFLYLNNIVLTLSEENFEKLVRDVAEGKKDKKGIAQVFRANAKPMR